MEQQQNAMAAVVALTLESAENAILAAANNALTGFGEIPKQTLAYEWFLSKNLIKPTGGPTFDLEVVLSALNNVINKRVEAGLFK